MKEPVPSDESTLSEVPRISNVVLMNEPFVDEKPKAGLPTTLEPGKKKNGTQKMGTRPIER